MWAVAYPEGSTRPPTLQPQEQVEKFYETLTEAVMGVPAHNFLMILGDFNARMGPKDAPFTYHDGTNRKGALLAEFVSGKMWTSQDRGLGMRLQLDYVLLMRSKWRNIILNSESCSSFKSVGSDLRVVSMRVRLNLRVPKPSSRTRYNGKEFSSRPDIQKRYTVVMRNYYHS
ncbi:craniofacial development protein 2-like [Patiria miniata]|uniref:Endonuclease/exonuclease/phosphatase domain-containing protein n=1 Tax=Patiria miniata TaxID=46514 RepID=A0A914BMU8_PATMI|nr:craniofacial development protein 2-like [Patiria miniata]